MQLPSKKELKDFETWKKKPPTLETHRIEDSKENPLSKQLLPPNCRNWHMEGNELCCDTDFGPLRQRISTDYICKGTDEKGLPILEKVV